jgi:hypothetical protein
VGARTRKPRRSDAESSGAGIEQRAVTSEVQFCRTIDADHRRQFKAGFYDVVAGPVTGDWKEQTIVPNSDQMTFHTGYAVSILDGSQKDRVV